MAVNITVTQALKLIGEILQVAETYKKSGHKVADDITLVEGVITILTTNNVGLGDVAEVLAAIKPYIGLVSAVA